jgi:drug/metabolite transporter (DMT)-like permease
VIVGLAVFRERLSPPEMAGVLCLAAGIWVVRRPAAAGPALVPALLTGVTIAAYTSVDSVGVHHAPPWLYGWAMSTLTALLLLALPSFARALGGLTATSRRGPHAGATIAGEALPSWRLSVVLGLMINSGYYLILVALRIAPLAIVAPLRESAIVLVAVWGMWRLHERQGAWLRAAGALTIALGAVLVAAAGSGS